MKGILFCQKLSLYITCQIVIIVTVLFILGCHPDRNNKDNVQAEIKPNEMSEDAVEILKTTSTDGTVIGYTKSGSGKPILFVHGSTADHKSWNKLSGYLSREFTIYAMDRRGRGLSSDGQSYDFRREVEDIIAVIADIGEPLILFGHSFGGTCALEAVLKTDRVSQLILYEPALPNYGPPYPDALSKQIQNLVDSGQMEKAMEMTLKEFAKMPEDEINEYRQSPLWKERIPNTITVPREITAEMNYHFNEINFKSIPIPVLLILGGESPEFSKQTIEYLDNVLPNSQIAILSGQQHIGHHLDPQQLANILIQFQLD